MYTHYNVRMYVRMCCVCICTVDYMYARMYVRMPMSGVCENTHAYSKSVSRSSETSANEKGTEPIRANKFEEFSTIEKGIAVQEAKCTLRM